LKVRACNGLKHRCVIRQALSSVWSCKCFGIYGYDTVCRLAENRSVGGSIPPEAAKAKTDRDRTDAERGGVNGGYPKYAARPRINTSKLPGHLPGEAAEALLEYAVKPDNYLGNAGG
jgi:hypothetical protein